jgi:hypothetical protein
MSDRTCFADDGVCRKGCAGNAPCAASSQRTPCGRIRSALAYYDACQATRIAVRFEDDTELDLPISDFLAWLKRTWHASETTAGSEPGLTVQGYRFPASLVRGLTPFGEQQAVNEAAWELVRRKADTNMNRCQELAQAAVAAYRASVERQLNPMEQSATLAGSDPATDALDAICKMLGCTTWEYPGQVVRDVKMAVDAMREVLKCGEEGLMIDEHLHNRIERLIGRTDSTAVKR